MKKINFRTSMLIVLLIATTLIQAQDYQVSFAIEGWTDLPDSILVENLDQGTSLTLNGDDVLHLLYPVGINDMVEIENELNIYPNPMKEDATIEYFNPGDGNVSLMIFDISGRIIAQHSENLPKGKLTYKLSGLSNGTYFVKVNNLSSEEEGLSSVIISQMGTAENASIELESVQEGNQLSINYKSTKLESDSIYEMPYYDGETLKFTAWFQASTTVEEFVITETQTINFDLVETVTDVEGNVYLTITIGEQTWMAENLRATHLNNGDSIPYIMSDWDWTTATGPAVNWFEHNQAYAEENNMGALYNWFTVETGNLCPTGWHVPTNDEFEEFTFYLAANGYNYDGSIYTGTNIDDAGEKVGKAIAEKQNWLSPTYGEPWAIGKDMHLNNSSFFNGVGASGRYMMTGVFGDLGYLCNWWTSTPHGNNDAWTFFMYTEETMLIQTYYFKEGGYSVRCLKDEE